jgi:hypothetical protein
MNHILADSGFYCWEAIQAYEKRNCRFLLVARKTARLVDQLKAADWKPSRRTDADGQCEFFYQPEGWGKSYRFLALRYERKNTLHLSCLIALLQGGLLFDRHQPPLKRRHVVYCVIS